MSRNTYIIYCDSTSFSSILSSISPIISRIQVSVINGSSIPQKTVSTNGFKMTKVRNLFMELVKKFFAAVPYDGAAA